MYKFHTQYWWHLYTKESNKDFEAKYYLEHLRSQAEARDTEKEIGTAKAQFLAEVVKFEKLKGKKFDVYSEKLAIENIVFPKAKSYSSDISSDKLRNEMAEPDEQYLREQYFNMLTPYQDIINKMN